MLTEIAASTERGGSGLDFINRKWPESLIQHGALSLNLTFKTLSMKNVISTLALAFVVLLASCGTANVKEPEYRDIREIKMLDFGVLTSTAGIDFIFYNPNNFGVQLTEARGDVYIDNKYFGRFFAAAPQWVCAGTGRRGDYQPGGLSAV